MLQSWKLGRLFGIDVFVHWSFVLVPLMVAFNSLLAGSLAVAPYALTVVLALFGCVLLHEFGHALTARRFGIPTRDITLYPIGGIARLERMTERPSEEFWIALAGPAVNVVIALLLLPLIGTLPLGTGEPLFGLSGNLFLDLMVVNIGLVVFNMLPAFPSDGGRVLRSVLAMFLNRVRATEIAVWIGVAMAIGIALYAGTFMAILVAAFLIFAGQQELAAVRYQHAQGELEPLTMVPATVDLPSRSYGQAYTGIVWDAQLRAWVLWRNGRPVSVLD